MVVQSMKSASNQLNQQVRMYSYALVLYFQPQNLILPAVPSMVVGDILKVALEILMSYTLLYVNLTKYYQYIVPCIVDGEAVSAEIYSFLQAFYGLLSWHNQRCNLGWFLIGQSHIFRINLP